MPRNLSIHSKHYSIRRHQLQLMVATPDHFLGNPYLALARHNLLYLNITFCNFLLIADVHLSVMTCLSVGAVCELPISAKK